MDAREKRSRKRGATEGGQNFASKIVRNCRHASLRCSTCILSPTNFAVQLWSLSYRCRLDNILQVGAWLTDGPEHEYYRIVLSTRALHVNAKGTIFCKLKLASGFHPMIAIATQSVAGLLYLPGGHFVLSLCDVQVYLQNFVLLP